VEDDEISGSPRSHGNDENAEKVRTLVHAVNPAYYVEILKRLREAVNGKRPELWPKDCILHHENVPAHKAPSVQ
jgi:hypothetical protein